MSDAEDTKQRLELLKMARVLLNEEYINRRAEDHNKWLADCDVVWREQRIKLPYPAFAPYPTEEQIVSKATALYGFINPIGEKTNAALGTLTERESQVVATVVKNAEENAKLIQPTISSWEKYLAPAVKELPVEEPKVEEPVIEEPVIEEPVIEEPKVEAPAVAVSDPTKPIKEIFKLVEPVIADSTDPVVIRENAAQDNEYDTTVPASPTPTRSTTVYSGISAGKDQSGFSSVKSLIPNFWRNRDGEK